MATDIDFDKGSASIAVFLAVRPPKLHCHETPREPKPIRLQRNAAWYQEESENLTVALRGGERHVGGEPRRRPQEPDGLSVRDPPQARVRRPRDPHRRRATHLGVAVQLELRLKAPIFLKSVEREAEIRGPIQRLTTPSRQEHNKEEVGDEEEGGGHCRDLAASRQLPFKAHTFLLP